MLFVSLVLFSLLNSPNRAWPIIGRAPPSTLDAETDKRSTFNIMWNCAITTFLCAWVSVHPNIQPYDGRFKKIGRRIGLSFLAVVAPELIVIWATMEYLEAKRIRTLYEKQGWTMAHGYLLEMGGFALSKSKEPMKVDAETLTPETFDQLYSNIEFPTITEYEIQDHSKGDLVAKLLAAIKTSWFILECIVRYRHGLAITELELTTLALAALNVIILWLWRAKPLDMGVQVPVYLKEGSTVREGELAVSPPLPKDIPEEIEGRAYTKLHNLHEVIGSRLLPIGATHLISRYTSPSGKRRPNKGPGPHTFTMIILLPFYLALTLIYALATPLVLLTFALVPIFAKYGPVLAYISRLIAVMSNEKGDFLIYFRRGPGSVIPALFIGFTTALIFGGLHCVAWNFTFPTMAEQTIWRVMSLIITLLPVSWQLLVAVLLKKNVYVCMGQSEMKGTPLSFYGLVCLNTLFDAAYVPARLILMALALAALREQPASAYVAIRWTEVLRL